jgi:hypothetical protein
MACPYDGQIELFWVFLPVTVDKIYQDERIINNDSGESQETDQGNKGQGIIADK